MCSALSSCGLRRGQIGIVRQCRRLIYHYRPKSEYFGLLLPTWNMTPPKSPKSEISLYFIRKVNDNCLCSPQTLIYLQPGSFQEGFVYRNMLNAEFAFAAYGGSPPNRQIFLFRAESASALYGIPREMMGHFPRNAHTVRRHSQPAASTSSCIRLYVYDCIRLLAVYDC